MKLIINVISICSVHIKLNNEMILKIISKDVWEKFSAMKRTDGLTRKLNKKKAI